MTVRLLRFLSAGVLLAFAAGAQAQTEEPNRWYLAAGVGATFYDDMTFTGAVTGDISMDTGYTGNVAIGRYLDDIKVFRVELEGAFSATDFNNSAGFKANGDINNANLMLNIFYDINTDSPWVPFFGGGIGYSRVTINNLTDTATGTVFVDGSDNVFAYQFKGGVKYKLSDDWAITVAYRYFATDNLAFSTPIPGTTESGGIRSHNAELGFQWDF